jgi:hypothetical protein
MKTPRPFSVILLALLALFFSALNLARAIQTVQYWNILKAMALVSPIYLLVSGLIWGVIGLGLSLGLWKGWRNAARSLLPFVLAYSLYAWIDRLALPGYAGRNQNWLFMLVINLLVLALVVWVMSRRKVKSYFGETHEQFISEQPALAGSPRPAGAGPAEAFQDPARTERENPPTA